MSGIDELARRYRSWLRWYPRAFRDEYAAEMLGVLLDCAGEGQRRPTPMECLDLAVNGLRMRVRAVSARPEPDRSRPGMGVILGIGAALELAAAVTILATAGSIRGSLIERFPGLTSAEWSNITASHLAPVVLGACIGAAAWVVLGWAIARGHRLARVAFAGFFGINLFGLFDGLSHDATTFAPAAVAVGACLCLVQLIAVARSFDRELAAVSPARQLLARMRPPNG